MKIIIYALGQIFENFGEDIDWKQVVALADKTPGPVNEIDGIPVILPDAIGDFTYDFIVVFSNQLFEEIRMELAGKYFIPKEKIISWREILIQEQVTGFECLQFYKIFFRERRCKKVLDIGMSVIPASYLSKEEFLSVDGAVLHGIWGEKAICNVNVYDYVYKNIAECKGYYDAVLAWDGLRCSENELKWMKEHARYILLYSGHLNNGVSIQEIMEEKLRKYGKVSYISNAAGIFWIIDTINMEFTEDIAIYVVTHKSYNVQMNTLYVPLCVGMYEKEGYLAEHTGENITYLNGKINECTALYWIWKNTNTKYVGLNHYRRYFYNNELVSMDNYLDMAHVCELMREYDMILPVTFPMGNVTVFEQIYNTVDHELCRKAYTILRNKIANNQPDYLQSFDNVMNGHNSFLCNMFVTRREILNRYCEWLFSFLIDVAEEVDVEGYDSYSQRVVGFFAERMWTVWLRKNRLKIKELPYVLVK